MCMWKGYITRENNIHTCLLYENVVNVTKVAWYKVVNTTQLENLAGSKNGLGFRIWIVATTFMQEEMQCMGCDFDVNAYLPLVG